ncbi:MAG TPA: hypothetical protein VLT36_19175 [Candidatus Dormibacteraeota bacterium]|nr:hypothetical protein [Candidatus Dormibacteraeota bacterium]
MTPLLKPGQPWASRLRVEIAALLLGACRLADDTSAQPLEPEVGTAEVRSESALDSIRSNFRVLARTNLILKSADDEKFGI